MRSRAATRERPPRESWPPAPSEGTQDRDRTGPLGRRAAAGTHVRVCPHHPPCLWRGGVPCPHGSPLVSAHYGQQVPPLGQQKVVWHWQVGCVVVVEVVVFVVGLGQADFWMRALPPSATRARR